MKARGRIAIALLLVIIMVAMFVPAAQAGSGEPWNQPGMRALRRFIQVSVTTPTGRLMPSWRSFLSKQYSGWELSQGPFQVGRWWYVVLTRMTYTTYTLPGVVAPYLNSTGSCYPVYFKGCTPRSF